jgi:hypothetical protein
MYLILPVVILSLLSMQMYVSGQADPVFCQDGQERSCGKGACRGVTTCIGGVWADECRGGAQPIFEVCDNGIDDDCDGIVDDDCGDATMDLMSYIMIGAGAGLLIFAIVVSKIQSRKMEEDEGGEEEKTIEGDQE